MSLHPQGVEPIPEETCRVARAAFPRGNPYLRMRDEMGTLVGDAAFADLFAVRGQPGLAPWRLALVTLFQYAEDLADRQAADAVRGRIDWKYALGLALDDPGFDYSGLSEFRTRLLSGQAEARLFEALLDQAREHGLLKQRGRQRTDSTHVLGAVRVLNRLDLVAEALRQIWLQQYQDVAGCLVWRDAAQLPPADRQIRSPHDPQARLAKKRTTVWTGYKVHLTEQCDPEVPHLITQVTTTPAPRPDQATTAAIDDDLAAHDHLPADHLVDAGYLDADVLVSSAQAHGVQLVGPVCPDTSWQARQAVGFAAADFAVDWEAQQVRCPSGKTSASWQPTVDRYGTAVIEVKFARGDCRDCALRPQCTRTQEQRRMLTLRPRPQHEALRAARARQGTRDFAPQYAARAGIEGTLSQGVRAFGLRQCRYRGEHKTRLQHLLTAAALNFVRMAAWLIGVNPAQTRQSAFRKLMVQSAGA
ncbi:MAG: transposase [Chloroflexota bacterium]